MRTLTSRLLWLAAALASLSTACASCAREGTATILRPGQDIQSIVASAPEGARFLFEPSHAQLLRPRARTYSIDLDPLSHAMLSTDGTGTDRGCPTGATTGPADAEGRARTMTHAGSTPARSYS